MAKPRTRPLIGWREWVTLTDLGGARLKAKVDTGARTSTLHAFDLRIVSRNGSGWAEFEVHPLQRSSKDRVSVSVPITGYRTVRSSTGHSQRRPTIRTGLRLGDHVFQIEVTLTARDEMGFRMLLGRAALRRRFWVDPGRSFVYGSEAEGPKGVTR